MIGAHRLMAAHSRVWTGDGVKRGSLIFAPCFELEFILDSLCVDPRCEDGISEHGHTRDQLDPSLVP